MNPYQPPQKKTLSKISIVSPSTQEQVTTPTTTPTSSRPTSKATNNANGKRTCRNVIIHGFCKYEGKGCEFNHETDKTIVLPSQQQQQQVQTIHSPENGRTKSVSAESIHAPIFVPKSSSSTSTSSNSNQDKLSLRPSIYSNNSPSQQQPNSSNGSRNTPFTQFGMAPTANTPALWNPQQMMTNGAMDPSSYYYMNTPNFNHHQQVPQYHKYAQTLPHVSNLLAHHRVAQSFYIPDNLREQLLKRNESTIQTKSAKENGLPEEVHVYHSLYPLEEKPGKILGHSSWVYKAICRVTGKHYTMVRIEGFRLVNEQAMSIVKKWRKIKHANIVSIREAFTTRAFGDSSLVFVYDYHPCSITLFEAYFTPQAQALLHARFQAAGVNGMPVPETTLWSFITQLSSAIKTIHAAGLSARTLEPNKILMTSKNRLRISCAGLLDVLQYDTTHQNLIMHQQEDLLAFGKLIVQLACNSTQSTINLPQSFEYLSRFYTPDLKNVALYLLSKPTQAKTIDEVFKLIGPRMLHEINSSQYYTDTLETNLGHELENDRIVRLLSKLGFIDERPEYNNDSRWSETGDRYIIKLFRDYMFHQVNDMGVPVTDMSHILSCLNKLDAGVEEKILLTSRDETTSIIVSYKELKACITSAFNDIYTTTTTTTTTTTHTK